MPFMTNPAPCKICKEQGKLTRYKFHYINNKSYLQSTCKDCEKTKFKNYQSKNLSKFREYNKEAYIKKYGPITRNMNYTPESKAQWYRDKSNKRCTRAKEARFVDELTKFITSEAHELRKLRNKLTGFEWHVDHIVPLKGSYVCGLHIWSNLAVIPKVNNLRKGNYYSIHD